MSQNLNNAVSVIGIDIGKNSFHVVGLDDRGAIALRQKWSRGQIEARLANMPPCLIGMEACVGAHHLSRKLKAFGHDARLMPAKYVRPYSKGQKNDFRVSLPWRLSYLARAHGYKKVCPQPFAKGARFPARRIRIVAWLARGASNIGGQSSHLRIGGWPIKSRDGEVSGQWITTKFPGSCRSSSATGRAVRPRAGPRRALGERSAMSKQTLAGFGCLWVCGATQRKPFVRFAVIFDRDCRG